MFVSDILSQKGGFVFTVTPGTSIAQVAQQFQAATEQMSNATQNLASEAERLKRMSGVFQV